MQGNKARTKGLRCQVCTGCGLCPGVVRENGLVLTVSETGYGRLSRPEDYRLQSRGGKGLTNYHIDKYGKVAAIKVVDLDDDVIIISQDGIIIRIAAESIRLCARPAKGVTVMKVGTTPINAVKPYQYYLATGEYPFIRTIWGICTDPRGQGTPRRFFNFCWNPGEQGQLVFGRAGLFPAWREYSLRDVVVK